MITAYNAYRLKQQPKVEGPTPTPKKGPNDPAFAVEWMEKTMMKIDGIDTAAWTDDERESFRVSLVALENKIDGFLAPNPGPA